MRITSRNLIGKIIIIIIISSFVFLLFNYISNYCLNTIYMDKTRLLANNLDKIMNNSLTIKDFFDVHSGHFSVGTLLILIFDVKILKLESMLFVKLIPLFIGVGAFLITSVRLKNNDKFGISDIIYTLIISCLLFSFFQWEIIWFSYGFIIFLSNMCFVITFFFLNLSFKYKDKKRYIVICALTGLFSAFLFGSGYDFAFLMTMIMAFIYGFIINFRRSSKYFYLFSAIIYCLFLMFLMSLVKGEGSSILSNILDLIKFYFLSMSSLLLPSEIDYSLTLRYVVGVLMLIIQLGVVIIYIFRGYYKKSLMPICLIVFSQLVFISIGISRLSYGLSYGTSSRYYASYVYSFVGTIDILIYALSDFKKIVSKLSLVVVNTILAMIIFLSQDKFYKYEQEMVTYRVELGEFMMDYTIKYDYISDKDLAALFQNDAASTRKCFDLLKKYNLYVYNLEYDLSTITDSFLTSEIMNGFYQVENENNRFISKDAYMFLKLNENETKKLSLYNPGNFSDNHFKIYVNKELVFESDIKSGEFISFEIDLIKGVNDIKIVLDFDTNLHEQGLSDDIRDLGLIFAEYNN